MRDGNSVRGMINSFSDASDTDYDKAISESRKRMEKLNPCESVREIDSLITRINMFYSTYYTRPCMEGYCWSLFTPHKSRMRRRIDAFHEERKVHEGDCRDFSEQQKRAVKQQEDTAAREAQIRIKEIETDTQKQIEKDRIEAGKQRVIEEYKRDHGYRPHL